MSSSQGLMPAPQELPQNLIYSTVLEVLAHTKPLPNQTKDEAKNSSKSVTEITNELKKILLIYLQLDPANTAKYFESNNSLLTSNKFTPKEISLLITFPIPTDISIALSRHSNNINTYTISQEEEKELTGHINRKIITYLLIRNYIANINTVYGLIEFKKFLILIKNNDDKLGGRGWAISNNMGKTIDDLIAYLDTMEGSTLKSKITQHVLKISEEEIKSILANKIRCLTPNPSQANIGLQDNDQIDKKEILQKINKLNEKKKNLVDVDDDIETQLFILNEKLKYLTEIIKNRLEYFIDLQSYINISRNIEIDKPVIAKLRDESMQPDFISELIKRILTVIYTNPLTKDNLIPIIEGYDRKTQMAYLSSISTLLRSKINFFTNTNLINITLSYLIEGTLTRSVDSDKDVVKINSLSMFSAASNTGTLAVEEPLRKNQTAIGPSL